MELIKKIGKKINDYGVLVMFSHTIFSLSFALISMLLAGNGKLNFRVIFWILVAFMSARTGANALNRVIDAEIDAKNPRTATRQLPQGLMNKKEILIFVVICFAIMVFAAWQLNTICFILSPIALFLMTIYSYTKRFTWMCHLVLGITSAAAPVGAWLAVTGKISLIPLAMGAANTLWVAGFDIIYGAQDYDFDTKNGIHSIPARFGVKNALHISSVFHVLAVIFLLMVGLLAPQLGIIYYGGLLINMVLFVIQHRLVKPDNLTNVKIASYSINQVISIVFLVTGLLDCLI
ncbi:MULTISPECIES: UbiA-like polyprenyltransferase [Turicibacter]|jgi:putative 4-hydroxybenzoate polyprenyltransferase|uniref:4-hydroxybenzoate polyprenyltransferase n=2 Tax=Turicibacter sanguinis TaxID=154288 RepID=A0A173THQ5_9FIRM|nr:MULTISPECIES: UbiA-like polyprenyltransferase [Turicibacter]EFF63370.1 putative 4-hydroxybenzoate polyprenyltransferase [Turicibacter sanguinis PC909]EGC91111.1 putative 4-hydroxybenzoate polyprenyltransferase [Turicibacter sp. HGF1]MBP3905109.1 UbiA family prenyltransferase [Turicibacter sp.]MCU7192468.1 putative 4-hydroxybenzoate polyprenyltransferase [Turicibacter sanguinis]MCU7197701.1 putative 4-hydroxybenzoate polyprenyltransferase [Turicibacter sanguinis]